MKLSKNPRRDKAILDSHHESIRLGLKPSAPDPQLLDEGIRNVALFLWDRGFWTFSCCEGGEGHGGNMPFVRLHASPGLSLDDTRTQASTALLEEGFRGFRSSSEYYHAPNHPAQSVPLDGFVHIEFVQSLPIRPYTQQALDATLEQEFLRVTSNEAKKKRSRKH